MIQFEKLNDKGILPVRATEQSVGYDFSSPETLTLQPNERVVVSTYVKCSFPPNLWLGIYGRSSFIKKGLVNPLGVGVVDADYYNTGLSIGIPLWNVTDKPITIQKGDAIGQGIFHPVILGEDVVTTKRTGGFGSTD